jgi:hypothetical protein
VTGRFSDRSRNFGGLLRVILLGTEIALSSYEKISEKQFTVTAGN